MEKITRLSKLSESIPLIGDLLPEDIAQPPIDFFNTFLNVVAIGNSGAGKSAVLNSILGHPALPTGEVGTTLTPVCLHLTRRDSLPSYTMKWQGTSGTTVLASTIRQYILKKFSDTGRSNDALTLKLCTSTAPPMNLIDFPGLRSAQPSYSLMQYAKSNNATLLVVIPASQALNVDSAKAIQVAKELDPSCSRIVGVISKIDRAASQPRVLAAVEELLSNEGQSFASGIPWVAVGEPIHIAWGGRADTSLEIAWRAEREDLRSLLIQVPQSKLGRESLVETLSKQIQKRMRQKLLDVLIGDQKQRIMTPHNRWIFVLQDEKDLALSKGSEAYLDTKPNSFADVIIPKNMPSSMRKRVKSKFKDYEALNIRDEENGELTLAASTFANRLYIACAVVSLFSAFLCFHLKFDPMGGRILILVAALFFFLVEPIQKLRLLWSIFRKLQKVVKFAKDATELVESINGVMNDSENGFVNGIVNVFTNGSGVKNGGRKTKKKKKKNRRKNKKGKDSSDNNSSTTDNSPSKRSDSSLTDS